jgi:hypothetical protein
MVRRVIKGDLGRISMPIRTWGFAVLGAVIMLFGAISYSPQAADSGNDLATAPVVAVNSGPQDVAVIQIDYNGDPYKSMPIPGSNKEQYRPDPAFLKEIFAGKLGGFSVADYFDTVSEGKTPFRNLSFFGPYYFDETFYCDHENQLWSDVVKRVRHDIDFSKYSRVLIMTPLMTQTGHCSYLGQIAAARAELTCTNVSTDQGNRCINFAWIGWTKAMQGLTASEKQRLETEGAQHGLTPDQIADMETEETIEHKIGAATMMTHETLHGFGLMHADTFPHTETAVVRPLNDTTTLEEQNDSTDVMSSEGSSGIGWLDGPHLADLGWLSDGEYTRVDQGGVYDLVPISSPQRALKVLEIPRKKNVNSSSATNESFWIEFRQPNTAYDIPSIYLPMNQDDPKRFGAIVHFTSKKYPYGVEETVVLQFNQAQIPSGQWPDYRLQGKWKDPYSGVTLEVLGQTTTDLKVRVSFE